MTNDRFWQGDHVNNGIWKRGATDPRGGGPVITRGGDGANDDGHPLYLLPLFLVYSIYIWECLLTIRMSALCSLIIFSCLRIMIIMERRLRCVYRTSLHMPLDREKYRPEGKIFYQSDMPLTNNGCGHIRRLVRLSEARKVDMKDRRVCCDVWRPESNRMNKNNKWRIKTYEVRNEQTSENIAVDLRSLL